MTMKLLIKYKHFTEQYNKRNWGCMGGLMGIA